MKTAILILGLLFTSSTCNAERLYAMHSCEIAGMTWAGTELGMKILGPQNGAKWVAPFIVVAGCGMYRAVEGGSNTFRKFGLDCLGVLGAVGCEIKF